MSLRARTEEFVVVDACESVVTFEDCEDVGEIVSTYTCETDAAGRLAPVVVTVYYDYDIYYNGSAPMIQTVLDENTTIVSASFPPILLSDALLQTQGAMVLKLAEATGVAYCFSLGWGPDRSLLTPNDGYNPFDEYDKEATIATRMYPLDRQDHEAECVGTNPLGSLEGSLCSPVQGKITLYLDAVDYIGIQDTIEGKMLDFVEAGMTNGTFLTENVFGLVYVGDRSIGNNISTDPPVMTSEALRNVSTTPPVLEIISVDTEAATRSISGVAIAVMAGALAFFIYSLFAVARGPQEFEKLDEHEDSFEDETVET